VPSAPRSPGITYVRWPRNPGLSAGATKLLEAYAGKQQSPIAECPEVLKSIEGSLGLPASETSSVSAVGEDSATLVQRRLDAWAKDLKPIAAVNTLAALAEANGASELAFFLVHKYWDDPRDRDSHDFVALRRLHGRLGMAQGLLSFTDKTINTSKHEESFQNLLRIALLHGDQRGFYWGALAWMWAGQRNRAFEFLGEADANAKVSAEVSGDTFVAWAELLFLAWEPEAVLNDWAPTAARLLKAGDLPRACRVIAVAALHYAEFKLDWLDEMLALGPVADALKRAQRLNDPVINGFLHLARGRQAVKARNPLIALDSLYRAGEAFKAGARNGWRIYSSIETVKALLDLERPQQARDLLGSIERAIDRYQVWLPWYQAARGQFHHCIGQNDEAIEAFRTGIGYAERMENQRMAEALHKNIDALAAET
jgi:tetratricopeptide (TPR) repeat protein